jgi:molybdate transport system substrate-binding protein
VAYGSVGALTDRLKHGEVADVAIVSDAQIDELQQLGKIVAGSHFDVAMVGVGIFVRTESPKPDISSVDAFKRTVLAAKAVAYSDPAGGGPAGIYIAHLMDQLGISVEMKHRTQLYPPGPLQYESVADGEADLGFEQVSLILEQPIVELLGPLPPTDPDSKLHNVCGRDGTSSDQSEAGRALVAFLSSPAAQDDLSPECFAASSEPPVLQESVHVDVGEQRADNTALRGAALVALATTHAPFSIVAFPFLDRRLQPQLDQPQHGAFPQ